MSAINNTFGKLLAYLCASAPLPTFRSSSPFTDGGNQRYRLGTTYKGKPTKSKDRYPAMQMHPQASEKDKMHWRIIPRNYGTGQS